MHSVVAFTDTYLPTVNGVTYTVQSWRERWLARGGRMDVVYPDADDYDPADGEYPIRSLPFPFYDGFRFGLPRVPRAVRDVDIVHAHTPFALGLGGLRLARREDLPFVVSYHTPSSEYASYLTSRERIESGIERLSESYERWFLGHAAAVVVPSEATRDDLQSRVGDDVSIRVVPNGVDIERFRPVDTDAFRERHDLTDAETLVGYTGRHGYEKCLSDIIDAADGLDATVVFGGDGPAREQLEARTRARGVDARFLGFLDREELPAFYSSLDAFLFPSPVETQGLVALEANACGTPVVGVDGGALSDTIEEGVTGYHYDLGDIDGFTAAIERTLSEVEALERRCLDRRESMSVEHAVDRLAEVYDAVRR
ncbi:glycosyl transferase family 1 [Haloprofundus marisrubri]|uniref:Glycosyl transferase family 1 n=1 Tax=Haloprofundus marisrubri TaxID=1514971 RepID=A0A0W1RCI0_9EURY|nr:glycosyltransferase [Haloprofundus marisrubri]KTG10323.1 glycosyl transferase family 1 [Haloprofundus marisrubri]